MFTDELNLPFLEEIVSFVVDHNETWEIDNVYLINGLHSKFWVL